MLHGVWKDELLPPLYEIMYAVVTAMAEAFVLECKKVSQSVYLNAAMSMFLFCV